MIPRSPNSIFVRIYAAEGGRLEQTFESFSLSLSEWPGMFIEPDGSFVWVQSSPTARWQLDGMIYDREGRIEYLELKGNCPQVAWWEICDALLPGAASSGNDRAGIDRASVDRDRQLRVHDVDRGVWTAPSAIAETLFGEA